MNKKPLLFHQRDALPLARAAADPTRIVLIRADQPLGRCAPTRWRRWLPAGAQRGARVLLPWQDADWTRFADQFARLPHALLFTGAAGIGKDVFAAMAHGAGLCEHLRAGPTPLRPVRNLPLVCQDAHPDFRLLRPDHDEPAADGKPAARKLEVIKIGAVRHTIDFAYLSSHRGGRRVVLIDPAESMNLNAANALLKVLEEPPADVVFLLVSDALQKLLPTPQRRCRIFPLTAPSQAQALAWLNAHGEADAAVELAHAGGAPFALDDAAWRPCGASC